MDKLPRSIVMSGDCLRFCLCHCQLDYFGVVREDEFQRRLSAGEFSLWQTREDVEVMRDLIRRGARREWNVRPVWVEKEFSEAQQFLTWCAVTGIVVGLRKTWKYVLPVRWTPALLYALPAGDAWPVAPRGAADGAWGARLTRRDEAARWIDQGGNADLARWLIVREGTKTARESRPQKR